MGSFISWLASLVSTPTKFLLALANEHKGVRRGLVIWSAMQVQWVIHKVFDNMEKITPTAITMATIIIAPLVGLIVYYVKLRSDSEGDDPADSPEPAKVAP